MVPHDSKSDLLLVVSGSFSVFKKKEKTNTFSNAFVKKSNFSARCHHGRSTEHAQINSNQ